MANEKSAPSNADKWIISIISGLLFLLIASPFLFTLVNMATQRFGLSIASPSGCPTNIGLLIHSVVFTLIVRLLML